MIKRVPISARIVGITLIWSSIVALEDTLNRHVCPILPSWLATICRLYPYLRGPGEWPPEWRWWLKYPVSEGGYRFDIVAWRLLVLGVVIGMLYVWWLWTRRKSRLDLLHLSVLSAIGLLLCLAIQFLSKNGIVLMTRMISPYYEPTYFLPAADIENLRDFLATYPDCLRAMNCPTHHMNSHPPGNVVLMWVFFVVASALPNPVAHWAGQFLRAHTVAEWSAGLPDQTLIAAGIGGMVIPALAALTVVPLYYLGIETVGHLRARRAIILFLLVPALPMFAPRVDLVYMLLGTTGIWLALVGLRRRSYMAAMGAGAVLSIAAFMSFATLVLVFIAAVVMVWVSWSVSEYSPRTAIIRLLPHGLAMLGGASLVWALCSMNPLQIYRYISSNYWGIQASRSYITWIFYGPYDLLFFAGVPATILFLLAVVRLGRRLWQTDTLTRGEILLASFVLATVILFVSGRLRGEVARTLLYCYPLVALGAEVEGDQLSERDFAWIATATLFQVVVYYYTLRVYHGG